MAVMIPNSSTPSGSKCLIWTFGKEVSIEKIFDHIDGEFFHVYMHDKDFGKKKYRTVGYENCELVINYKQLELF